MLKLRFRVQESLRLFRVQEGSEFETIQSSGLKEYGFCEPVIAKPTISLSSINDINFTDTGQAVNRRSNLHNLSIMINATNDNSLTIV